MYIKSMMEPNSADPKLTSSEYLAAQGSVQPEEQLKDEFLSEEGADFDPSIDSAPADYDLPRSSRQESKIAPGMYRPIPEEEIIAWTAASRPFKKRSRRFFTTILVIGLLVSLILFFAGQILPVAVVFSIIFMVYAMSVVPPAVVKHKITTFGIRIDGDILPWEELGRFWFETKFDQKLVNIETARFPNRISILLGDQTEEIIELILSEVLLKERPPLTQFEKMGQWLEQRIPLDID